MTTALGSRSSQVAILAVRATRPPARVSELACLAVYAPVQSKLTRTSLAAATVPYTIGKFTVPRTSQLYLLSVYGTGVPDQARSRAWSFVLDGHTFYVLQLGAQGTWCYDTTTKQWAEFDTDGYGQWNMLNGCMWGDRIVAGDSLNGFVWELVPSALKDDGWKDIDHAVTGAVAATGRNFIGCDYLSVNASIGLIDEVLGATVNLRYSDDNGQTWSDYISVAIVEGDTTQNIGFDALGSFASPGRIFEISDVGGLIRIDGCEMNPDAPEPPGGQ